MSSIYLDSMVRPDDMARITTPELANAFIEEQIKALRAQYPKANIVAIDYDPGASEANQLNRIKLMITTAKQNHLWEQEHS